LGLKLFTTSSALLSVTKSRAFGNTVLAVTTVPFNEAENLRCP